MLLSSRFVTDSTCHKILAVVGISVHVFSRVREGYDEEVDVPIKGGLSYSIFNGMRITLAYTQRISPLGDA